MKRKIALLLAAIMLVLLPACGTALPPAAGSGTRADPWPVGAGKNDDVIAFVEENTLWILGEGRMQDFESAEARPWDGLIGDLTQVSLSGGVESVGARAFMGAGQNGDGICVSLYSELHSIGESAFENALFGSACMLSIPETVKDIGRRAFADSNADELTIDSHPKIADDAFAGVNATLYVRASEWDEGDRLSFGGDLRYVCTYAVQYAEDYGNAELDCEGTIYYPAGSTFVYDAEASCPDENYRFVRYEVLSGDLELADPGDPLIYAPITGDVELRIVYAAK